MIEIKNVSKTIGNRLVLDNINCTMEYGNVYGLCGTNGSGKTMLLIKFCTLSEFSKSIAVYARS